MGFSNQSIVQGKFFTWSFCWISSTWSILGVDLHCQLGYLPASFPGFGPLIWTPAGWLLLERHKYFPPKRRLGTTDSSVCARIQPEARAKVLIMPNTQGLQHSPQTEAIPQGIHVPLTLTVKAPPWQAATQSRLWDLGCFELKDEWTHPVPHNHRSAPQSPDQTQGKCFSPMTSTSRSAPESTSPGHQRLCISFRGKALISFTQPSKAA